MERAVIIGAGQAGAQAAASLRQAGFSGAITLLGEEPFAPYQRPPLSKAYLQGELDASRLALRAPEFFATNAIELRTGARAIAIDRKARIVTMSDGERLSYDKLLLATGAGARRMDAPGAELPGVFYLRSIADADALGPALRGAERLVVIGAGYIGLEAAASARKFGVAVAIIEALDRPLARVAGTEVSAYFLDLHRSHGVTFHFGARLAAFEGGAHVEAVRLEDGRRIACNLAVVGVGAVPNVELAAAAGLRVADGVLVDERAQTEDPAIFAAGDCTNFPSPLYGRRMRLESVPNAIEQAKVAGAVMAGGEATYDSAPWFWSDQYDVKLQTAGLCAGADAAVVRGALEAPGRSVWYLQSGRLIAVDAMNDGPAFAAGKRLIAARASPDPKFLADPLRDLKSLLS